MVLVKIIHLDVSSPLPFLPQEREQTLVCLCPTPHSCSCVSMTFLLTRAIPAWPRNSPLRVFICRTWPFQRVCFSYLLLQECWLWNKFSLLLIHYKCVCSEVRNKASNRYLGAAGIEPRLRQVLLEHNKHFPYFPCLDALLSFGSLLSSQCSFLSKIYPAKAPTLNSSGEAFMVQPSPSSSELYSCL